MEVTAHLIHRWRSASRQGRQRILVGICGRAGAGKTTLAESLARELREEGIGCLTYTGDWRMSMDSASRKEWIGQCSKLSLSAFLGAINQFTWWDFARIQDDLARIMAGQALGLQGAYDRSSGRCDLLLRLPALESGVVLFENAILGGVEVLDTLEMILLLNTPDRTCFERILAKDATRRSIPEIAARYLMTTYSENFFLELLGGFRDKTVACDAGGAVGALPELVACHHVPILRDVLVTYLPVPAEGTERIEPAAI